MTAEQKKNAGYLLAALVVYGANLYIMASFTDFPLEESLGVLVIFGLFFPALALVLTRKSTPLYESKPVQRNERTVLVMLVLYITLSLIPGNKIITWMVPDTYVSNDKLEEVISLLRKVITFVIVPLLAYRFLFGFSLKDFGFEFRKAVNKQNLLTLLVIGLVLVLFNYYGGSGAKPLRDGQYSAQQLLIGAPLLFTFLVIEVGLVEEFFFRALLLQRLEVILKSGLGALLLSSFIFGLVHAPGMYLRGAGVFDNLGTEPSLWVAIGYCIAVQSVAGILFGVLWLRTKSIWMVILLHAVLDTVPQLAGFIDLWKL